MSSETLSSDLPSNSTPIERVIPLRGSSLTTSSIIELAEMTRLIKEIIQKARFYAIMLYLGHVSRILKVGLSRTIY